MAFAIDNLGNISANGKTGVPCWWTYNGLAESDTLATIRASGYFNGTIFGTGCILSVNDIIYVEGSDDNEILVVTAVSPNVTTAVFVSALNPAVVPVFAGTTTWTGGAATLALTVTGVLATDNVQAMWNGAPTQASNIEYAVPTTNTITFTASAANTSNDGKVGWVVFRATT